ncbi:hypothetical protein CHELA1G11_10332 [Hyphomicrobiales bacterium]|nr:hypothetical protein CHELA1G11_10332 [Hyphomicrobiales bacterium]
MARLGGAVASGVVSSGGEGIAVADYPAALGREDRALVVSGTCLAAARTRKGEGRRRMHGLTPGAACRSVTSGPRTGRGRVSGEFPEGPLMDPAWVTHPTLRLCHPRSRRRRRAGMPTVGVGAEGDHRRTPMAHGLRGR